MLRELELRSIPSITQQLVRIEYKGLLFDEPLRFDIMVDSCLLLELKARNFAPIQQSAAFQLHEAVGYPHRVAYQFS
jgi:PD-(D/E)XK nuclease superfamily